MSDMQVEVWGGGVGHKGDEQRMVQLCFLKPVLKASLKKIVSRNAPLTCDKVFYTPINVSVPWLFTRRKRDASKSKLCALNWQNSCLDV